MLESYTMCGVVGYIGERQARNIILNGLKSLEYRGYDSAGVALLDNRQNGRLIKQVGRVDGLASTLDEVGTIDATVGIGHTRWASNSLPRQILRLSHTS